MGVQYQLNQRQKAAVIVRLLLDDEDAPALERLDSNSQTLLAEAMAGLELVDRQTRDAIIGEFCDHLEAVGLTFPGDLDGTLAILGDRLSQDSTDRLHRMAIMSGRGDPWSRISALPRESLLALANSEPVDIIALMLSKLPVARASEAFSALDKDRARLVAQAMSLTAGVSAEALQRVGMILLQAAENLARPALDTPAADRVGALLNSASSDLRNSVLEALDQSDEVFAGGVRRAIFIFAHIPARIQPRDVPRIARELDQPTLVRALLAPGDDNAATSAFILENLSQRMADTLREEMAAVGKIAAKDAEEAMTAIVTAIRNLQEAGELELIAPTED